MSPWEKAMKGDESLIATMKSTMPGPIVSKDQLKYKCFNRYFCQSLTFLVLYDRQGFNHLPCSARSAMPFGGYEKANQLMKFQLPQVNLDKKPEPSVMYQQDVSCRPSFNRTPIGWMGSCEPGSIHMETDAVPFDGETDEL